MTDLQLLDNLKSAEKLLGFSSRQFSGAVVVSLLRDVLKGLGIASSEKDVFLKGVPIEVDFLAVKDGSSPCHGVLWNPEDVLAAFEIKKSGVICETGRSKINSDFSRIRTYHPNIRLFYVTFSETRDKVGDIKRSDDSFTFFIRRGKKFSSTGDFGRFCEVVTTLRRGDGETV